MVSYTLEENTSTTSCMSESGSNSDGPSYIGDIDVSHEARPQRSRLEAHIRSEEKKNSSSDGKDDEASHDDSLTYDTFMKEIQKDIWEQVAKKKQKRQKKKSNQLIASNIVNNQPHDNHHENYLSIAEQALHLIAERRRSSQAILAGNAATGAPKSNPYQEDAGLTSIDENSANSNQMPRHHRIIVVSNHEMERTMIWDVQDDFESLLVEEPLVLEEPSTSSKYDPFEGIDEESMGVPPFPTGSLASKEMEEAELDSVFDSILHISIDGAPSGEKRMTTTDQSTIIEPPSLHISSRDPPSEKGGALPSPSRHPPKEPHLAIKISGSEETTTLRIPISLIEKRENDMFKIAFNQGIKPDKWNGSLLSKKMKSLLNEQGHPRRKLALDLYPERECAEANFSQSFRWQSWMHDCLESFYKNGAMRIPGVCIGSDILVALQYFGILYTQEQLIFDSFETFLRVKKWSEYFTYRSTMAQWIVKKLRRSGIQCVFSTCPYPLGKGHYIRVGAQETKLFDGGLFLNPSRYGTAKSSTLVFSFFNKTEDEIGEPSNVDQLMREDFCNFFQNLFPGTRAIFLNKRVIIGQQDGTREQMEASTLYVLQETSTVHVDQDDISAHYYFASRLDSDEATESTCQSPPMSPNPSLLQGCQLLGAHQSFQCTGLVDKQCTGLGDKTKEVRKPQNDSKPWIPMTGPECVSAASYMQYKDSQLPNMWKSSLNTTSEPISIVSSSSMSVKHIEPLPTMSGSEASVNPEPMNEDHVYQDLWLEDLGFQEECDLLRDHLTNTGKEQTPATRDTPEAWIPEFKLDWGAANQQERQGVPKDRSLLDQAQCVTADQVRCTGPRKMKYIPNECVLAELYRPKNGQQYEPGLVQMKNTFSTLSSKTQRSRHVIDISALDDASAAESSIFDGIIPKRMWPYDEPSANSYPA